MTEVYSLHLEQGHVCFTQQTSRETFASLEKILKTGIPENGVNIVCRMGDPDLVNCVVYKRENEQGGIFAVHDKNGLLFVALAPNNLLFAIAQGYFGNLVANARYGVDVFENLEVPDD